MQAKVCCWIMYAILVIVLYVTLMSHTSIYKVFLIGSLLHSRQTPVIRTYVFYGSLKQDSKTDNCQWSDMWAVIVQSLRLCTSFQKIVSSN